MTDEAAALPNWSARLPVALLQRSGGIAFLVLLAVILLLIAVSPNRVSYFDLSTISASGTTLALAAIGETIVVLGGGLDLSPGAVISLVNVILVTQLGPATLGVGAYTALAIAMALGIGAGIGAINGLLVSELDSHALAAAIARLLTNLSEVQRLGEAARETVIARFSADRMVEDTLRLYEKLVTHDS